MANEFVARNGIIALNNSQVTGSTQITGSLNVVGNTGITGSLTVVGKTSADNAFLTLGNPGAGGGGTNGILFNYGINGASRIWQIKNDQTAFGDLWIAQSSTQTAGPYVAALYIDPNRNVAINKTTANSVLDISGSTIITGSLNVTQGITGSLSGTSSYALTASYLIGGSTGTTFPYTGSAIISGSLTVTGSLGLSGSAIVSNGATFNGTFTGSFVDGTLIDYIPSSGTGRISVGPNDSIGFYTGYTATTSSLLFLSASGLVSASSFSGRFTGSLSGTSSYALTASYLIGGSTGTTFPYTGSAIISGSLLVTGSLGLSGSAIVSNGASFNGLFTGSFVDGIIADYNPILGQGRILVGANDGIGFYTGYPNSSSLLFLSGSGLVSASSFSGSFTGSLQGSASYALSASYAPGGGSTFPYTGNAVIIGTLAITGSVSGNVITDALTYGTILATVNTDQNDWSPTGWNDADPGKATTIAITGSNSVIISGLTGSQDGRVAIIKNISTDYLVILPDYSSLSSAANRFDFKNPVFLLPNGSITLMYDGLTSRWIALSSSGGIGYGAFFNQWDDFVGGNLGATGVQSGPWSATFSGTGASVAASTYLQNTSQRPLGAVQLTTGTTATGRGNIGATQSTVIIPGQGQALMLTRKAVQQLYASSSNSFISYAGWHNAANQVSASYGAFWEYNSGSKGVGWVATTISASVSKSVLTSLTASTNYVTLGMFMNSTWTKATYFYYTGSSDWTIATVISSSMPTASLTTGFGVAMSKISGATAQLNSVDFLAHRYDTSRL